VTPPFEHGHLNFVVKSAALDAHRRRKASMRAADA